MTRANKLFVYLGTPIVLVFAYLTYYAAQGAHPPPWVGAVIVVIAVAALVAKWYQDD